MIGNGGFFVKANYLESEIGGVRVWIEVGNELFKMSEGQSM
jgi:hypothetical protein